MGQLSREIVVDAGVDVVRLHGWAVLSLRTVATQLGVTPMALYRYVPDAAALARAVIGAIAAGIVEVPHDGQMSADFAQWARRARAGLAPFPGAAGKLLAVWFDMPTVLGMVEELLEIAYAGGLEGFDAVAAVNALFTFVLMRAQAEETIRNAGAVKRSLALARSTHPLPRLRSLARFYTTAEFDRHFEYGLVTLLAGIESQRVSP